jgi:hypothetical protein
MRLFEFVEDDPLRVKLQALSNQLKDRVVNSGQSMSTDELLNFFKDNDIIIDKSDLFDIVKKEPLVNIIHNVNKDEVIFKGQEGAEQQGATPKPSETKKTLSTMAKRAMK